MSEPSGESTAWMAAYHSQTLSRWRLATYGRKLRRLGIEPVSGQRTLDLACGAGEVLAVLARAGADDLVGLDLAAPPGQHRNLFRFVLGEGTCLPFGSATFDRVLCLHALHHFGSAARLERLLLEVQRVLTRAGTLFLVDHFDSLYLRLIFRLCEIKCPLYPAAVRHFGVQLREEREYLYWWLEQWESVFPALARTGFEVQYCKKRVFFFYLACRPR